MNAALQLDVWWEPICSHMEQVEHLLHETLSRTGEPLGPRLCGVMGGGKRVRPALILLSGCILASDMSPFYRLAAAVEMLHTATLIHDDVLDQADLRRGMRTLHTTWPVGVTVLAGDYLLAQAASLVAELGQPRILKVFADALCAICAGEIRQAFLTRGSSFHQDYYRSIEAKTASLFAAATEMAGILAGAEEAQVAALRHFGHELGLAFQIVDDVLDLTGDEVHLGKPAGSDLCQGLITLPVLYYLQGAGDEDPVQAVLSGRRDAQSVRAAIAAVRASGAIASALAEARAHARQGQEALAALPDRPARQTLCLLAEYVVQREM